jgi:hypothetical protein
MKFKLITVSLALLITKTVLAAAPAIPTTCPSVDAFKSVGVSSALKAKDGSWAGIEWKNHFGTEYEWTFGVVGIKADSANEAVVKSNAAISTLTFSQGPIEVESEQTPTWLCLYNLPERENSAVAITPAMNPNMSKLARIMQIR